MLNQAAVVRSVDPTEPLQRNNNGSRSRRGNNKRAEEEQQLDGSREVKRLSTSLPEHLVAERVDQNGTEAPLHACVRAAVENYLSHLSGELPNDLYDMVIGQVEAPLLSAVMRYTDYNQTKTAGVLGVNRGTLRRKLKKYKIPSR